MTQEQFEVRKEKSRTRCVCHHDSRARLARALEVPLYQLFYEGEEPSALPRLLKRKTADETAWGSTGKEARFLEKSRRLLARMKESDWRLLLHMAQKMSRR